MLQIGGIVVLFACVFGGYLMTGGSLGVVFEALPHEMLTIFGAAIAAMLIAGSMYNLKKIVGSLGKVISGPKLEAQRLSRPAVPAVPAHQDDEVQGPDRAGSPYRKAAKNPRSSSAIPRSCKDHFALDFICDTLRMMTMSLEDPHQVETAMEKQLEKHHHEALVGANALQTMADGLPALGIVAAVLGVIKTMGAISEPPEVLGGMIGSALVGTFLGVFLAYGIVGPMGTRLKAVVDEDALFYHVIRDILVAHLHGNAAQVSVEIGRGSVPCEAQPSFQELEEALNAIPPDGG